MARGAATLASFLDKQHDPTLQDSITYIDDDGDRCAMAYKVPMSAEDIRDRGKAYYEWATWSNGMFGRTPDYKNASVMAFSAATDFLAQGTKGQADFAKNMVDYYDYVRKNDKVLTHTLVNPAVSHQQASSGKFSGEEHCMWLRRPTKVSLLKARVYWQHWVHWLMRLKCFYRPFCALPRRTYHSHLPLQFRLPRPV